MDAEEPPPTTPDPIGELSDHFLADNPQLNAEQALTLVNRCRNTWQDVDEGRLLEAGKRMKRYLALPSKVRTCLRASPAFLLLFAMLVHFPLALLNNKFEELEPPDGNILSWMSAVKSDRADSALFKKVTPDQESLLLKDSMALRKKHPNDIRYLSDYLVQSRGTQIELFEEARERDPDNAWLTLFHAATIYQDEQLEKEERNQRAFALFHLAAAQPRYERYPSQLHSERVSLLTKDNLGTDLNRIHLINNFEEADLRLIETLLNDVDWWARGLLETDPDEARRLTLSFCAILNLIIQDRLSGPQVIRLERDSLNHLEDLASSCHLLDLEDLSNSIWEVTSSLKERKSQFALPESSRHPGMILKETIVLTGGLDAVYEFEKLDSRKLLAKRVRAHESELLPGRWKWFLALEGFYAEFLSPFLLPFAFLFLVGSIFGSHSNKNFAFTIQPLISRWRMGFFFALSFFLPLLIYFIITRWTPFGLREQSLLVLNGDPIVSQLNLTFLLVVMVTLALAGQLVRSTFQPLKLSKSPTIWSWLPVLLLTVALVLLRDFPQYEYGEIQPSRILVMVACGFVLLQFLLSLTGHGNTPVARVLVCRLACASLAISSLAFLLLSPLLALRESHWAAKDTFCPLPDSTLYTTRHEAEVCQKIEEHLRTDFTRLPTE